jgi:hypothetical protein
MRIIKRKKTQAVFNLENKVISLSVQLEYLIKLVVKQQDEIEKLRLARPPVENIRVVPQKVNPDAPQDARLDWTTEHVNNHLNSLSGLDLQDIVESAITGEPIIERKPVQHHPQGTQGKMTDWLNANIPVINTQDNIWNTIAESKQLAKERQKIRIENAKEFSKEWKNAVGLKEAAKLADVDTAKI